MGIGIQGIIDAVASDALKLGVFEWVNTHEPKSAPHGLGAAIWVQDIRPAPSGLDSTTVRLTLNVRVFTSMTAEPQDMIDPQLVAAVDALMAAYTGGFTLGGLVRSIDLLGNTGEPLAAQAGYVKIGDRLLRIITITLPMIINDVWAQVP
jgi:hypothetical protein